MEIVYKEIDDLAEFEGNPRMRTTEVLEKLVASIREFGFAEPVILWGNAPEFDYPENTILGGHRRIDALRYLIKNEGMEPAPVPCVEIDCASVEKAKALNIALNKIGEEFDFTLLADWMGEIDVGDIDMTATGFSEAELEEMALWTPEEESEEDLDNVPEDAPTVCKAGDLWQLGDHRLLCGDATKAEDVARLMDGEKADMVFTDPPYGIGLEYSSYEDTENNLVDIVNRVMPIILEYSDRALITCGVSNIHLYPKPDWILSWYSSAGVGSGPWGFCCWQPILAYGKCPYLSSGKGRRRDIFESNEDASTKKHPCAKPMELWVEILLRGSIKKSDLILDLFIGSGSTIIACEKTKRRCYGMEIDPHYCDVVIKRWEDYTGGRAVKI